MAEKTPASNHFKYFLIACFSIVGIIGLCVIIGWHFRVRALIQIFPGTIPMQYNTALCFIVLALSSAAMILRRDAVFLPALGASLVSLFGILVVFQYSTGISLGIDTFFFYPWEQTLSAVPGRMALTTAACFAITGGTLSLLMLRHRTLIAFVIAHTFPLSLGMTSLLGYLFGITYVLPFHLGSQMAFHTATAFMIYGSAMLFYAWQYVPQTREGLPQWSPGIAVVMVPVLFVSLNSIHRNNSMFSRILQVLLVLGGTALLAFAIHKLTPARIFYKGLILIAIPLLFVLGFVLLVNQQKRAGEHAQALATHSEEVINQSYFLSEHLFEAESNLRGYAITENTDFLVRYEQIRRSIPENAEKLQALVSHNPARLAKAEALGLKANERLVVLEETKRLLNGGNYNNEDAIAKVNLGKRLMDEFRSQMNDFLTEEMRHNKMRQEEVKNNWQQFDWLLVAGTSADLLLALTLVVLFTRGIGRRLQILEENAQALADGKLLAQPLTGTDEIAKVDVVFHQMAQALQKSQDELESKVIERTGELSRSNELLKKEIAEREQAEAALHKSEMQLQQSQKLESIGQLAGGIAHDFNNLLTAINGYSELTLRRLNLDSPLRDNIMEIKKAGDRAASLTRQLLAFSRKQVLKPEIIDLNTIILEMEKMLVRLIGEDIELRTVIEPKLGNVKADPGQIEQVIMNLVVNARDAIPRGGTLTIETNNVYLDDLYTKDHVNIIPGDYIMLAVSDNGTGMDEETLQKIYEPFFTTKKPGQGTGLGLATVYGIVKQSGGNIWVYSEPGQGTTFKIYLPRIEETAKSVKRLDAVTKLHQGTENILLVEDEEIVRNLSRQILESCGYRVIEAQNGIEAIELCKKHDYHIDLLITDVIMPQMGGRELAEKLAHIYPLMKVLFTSGYTDDAIVRHGIIDAGTNFIEKPFTLDALTRKVRELLDAS